MFRAAVVGLMLLGMAASAGAREVDVGKVIAKADAAAARGEYARARRLYRWCADMAKTMKGRKSPEYAALVSNTAQMDAELGNQQEAIQRFHRAIKAQEAVGGMEDPALAPMCANLGSALARVGRFDEALQQGSGRSPSRPARTARRARTSRAATARWARSTSTRATWPRRGSTT